MVPGCASHCFSLTSRGNVSLMYSTGHGTMPTCLSAGAAATRHAACCGWRGRCSTGHSFAGLCVLLPATTLAAAFLSFLCCTAVRHSEAGAQMPDQHEEPCCGMVWQV